MRVVHLGGSKTLRQFAAKEKWHATSIVATMDPLKPDRPMVLTFVFIVTCLLAAGGVLAALAGRGAALVVLPLILVAPGATAAYKVVTCRNYRYFFQLLALYLIVYAVRTMVVAEGLLRRERGPRAGPARRPA